MRCRRPFDARMGTVKEEIAGLVRGRHSVIIIVAARKGIVN